MMRFIGILLFDEVTMDILKAFQTPPPEYSACAFWFWNGTLDEKRMLWQMDQLHEKGVYGAVMHARAYLKTPYMGDEWFRVMDGCVRRAKEIGFYPWLYDEYAWPSGTCGSIFSHGTQAPSRVLAKGRQNMAKGLDAEILHGEPDPARQLVAACPLGDGRTMAFYERVYEKAVDYLNPDAIRDFLDCTHEVYCKRYGAEFGKTIPGIFFDEIYLAAHPLPWTERLPEEFTKTYGYDLLPRLPALMRGDDDGSRQVRADYYALLAALYERAFFRQIADWCAQHGLKLTGHTEEDLIRHPRRQGDYFRTMRRLHVPGADCHDYRYRFPREISVHEPKFAVSVARLYGKPRAMSEAMGGAGWGCSLQEYKRGVNALAAMGINLFILHGFYNECEHQGSQADWPASLFYQNPYWKYFKGFAAYIHRISCMNSLGEAAVDVGIYYPVKEIAARTLAGEPDEAAGEIDRQFHQALRSFVQRQIDADFIDLDSLSAAAVRDGRLCAGVQKFRMLVFPSCAELTLELSRKLARFQSQGGMVLFYPTGKGISPEGFPPGDVCAAGEMPARFLRRFAPDAEVLEGSREYLYINRRVVEGRDVYLVASTLPERRALRLSLCGQGAALKLNPETGEATPVPYTEDDSRVLAGLELEADEACFLLLGCKRQAVPPAETPVWTETLNGTWEFLPLDAEYDGTWAAGAEETALSVPLARFTDERTGMGGRIRIQNTVDELGRCGRHVSLWKARWLGRRVGWGDDANKRDLYFVKVLTLEDAPLSARVCVAAVNEFTLYVNGTEIAAVKSDGRPCELELGETLRKGRNLLAVRVHTDTPLDGRELTEAETIPPDAPASLLLQGDIITAGGAVEVFSDSSWAAACAVSQGWETAEPDGILTVDPKRVLCHVQPGLKDTDWVWAWERGKPPMLPWGDLPLFGETPQYPRAVRYEVTLPAGTVRVDAPEVSGEYAGTLDGTPVTFEAGSASLCADGLLHILRLDVTAPSPDGGLLRNVAVRMRPFQAEPGDWREHGLDGFSGRALYRKTIELHKEPGVRYTLDLGRVCFYAEIWVNGMLCGARIWAPYRADISEHLRDGHNEIAVVAANSAACERRHMLVDEGMALAWNRYWNEDNIDREPENLVSGLLGPVTITGYAVKRPEPLT